MQPLTHHQIIELVEPFTRRGRHVDLQASNRLARCLVFKPVDAASNPAGRTDLRETLTLENPAADYFRLTQKWQHASGVQASLVAEAAAPEELLQRVEAVAPQRLFSAGPGFLTSASFSLEAPAHTARTSAPRMVLTEAVAQVMGFTLSLRVPCSSGPADIELTAPADSTVVLPEDLLAVIGWDWAPLLVQQPGVWTSRLRLRRREPKRSASAEHGLQQTVQHLVRVLSQPPVAFHDRHTTARWGAAVRRGIPSLAAIGLISGVATFAILSRRESSEVSPLLIIMFHVPTLLLALAFSMQESARFEIPPWPRRLKASAWPVPVPVPVPEDR